MTASSLNVFIPKILIFNFLADVLLCMPASKPLKAFTVDPEQAAGKTEGDMLLTAEQIQYLKNPIQPRNGLKKETFRWPNNVLYYKIRRSEFEPEHVAAIKQGIQTLENTTCVTFKEAKDSQRYYMIITSKSEGCFTSVGYQKGVQKMNLQLFPIGKGCFRTGTVLHEFMHALGFFHQHSSAIRDDYVTVIFENIEPSQAKNFVKFTSSMVTDFDLGYDYDSVMHYPSNAFSKNGEKTIVPKNSTAVIGQRVGMSAKDIKKINIMYKCLNKT